METVSLRNAVVRSLGQDVCLGLGDTSLGLFLESSKKCARSLQTILPAAAQDVYYRDEIGNVSTSHLLILDDSVEMEIRPRFPLFGGWKTHYIVGYNLPSYEYLYNLGQSSVIRGWKRQRLSFLTCGVVVCDDQMGRACSHSQEGWRQEPRLTGGFRVSRDSCLWSPLRRRALLH